MESDRIAPIPSGHNPAAFSLKFVFQMITACALFFAVFNLSPAFAIVSAVVIAPAIIRTVVIGDRHRRLGVEFNLDRQFSWLLGSIGIVLLTVGLAVGAFLVVSLAFGVLGMLMSLMLGSASLSSDAAVIGTVGGMIWGFGGAVLATGYSMCKFWFPEEDYGSKSA